MIGEDVEEEVFKGYDGHTLRRKPWFRYTPLCISREGVQSALGIGLTEIDGYFDDLWVLSNNRYHNQSTVRPLCHRQQWEEVIDKLLELAVSIESEFSRFDGCTVRVKVPIVGHLVKDEKRDDALMKSWFLYKGRHYDPNWVYELIYQGSCGVPHHLLPVCPLEKPCNRGTARDTDLPLSTENGKEIYRAKLRKAQLKRGYYEVDLGEVCVVKGLITLGAYPTKLELFPAKRYSRLRGNDKNRWRASTLHARQGGRIGRVHVIANRDLLSWVSSFTVQIRHPITGKWNPLPSVFEGNHDIATEKLHQMEINARYLRIFPREYHHLPEMRVRVLGERVDPAAELEALEMPAEIETVTYLITPEQKSPYHSSARRIKCSWDRKMNKLERQREHRWMNRGIEESIKEAMDGGLTE